MGDDCVRRLNCHGDRGVKRRPALHLAIAATVALGTGAAVGAAAANAATSSGVRGHRRGIRPSHWYRPSLYGHNETATPIKHLVVIFDENVSFDHYFGTYPYAANTSRPGHAVLPPSRARRPSTGCTQKIARAARSSPLLTHNPQRVQPDAATPYEALTSDQDHDYSGGAGRPFDNGKMDKFVQHTVEHRYRHVAHRRDCCKGSDVMDYYDGNTVTALWNYAQYYSR